MCLHVFSPGRRIHIDYAAESIVLSGGGSQDIFDLLITNHSDEVSERVHFIYPHGIPLPSAGAPSFADLTESWLQEESPYNRFYDHDPKLDRKEGTGYTELKLTMTDPRDITQPLGYRGFIRGRQALSAFAVTDKEPLTTDEWRILGALGWSAFTLTFDDPLIPREARWLRLEGRTGLIPGNRYHWLEYWLRKLGRLLTHTFEIAGPVDVCHRVISWLQAGAAYSGKTRAEQFSILTLHSLQEKLLVRALLAPGTETFVRDWRINAFPRSYRHCDEPTYWGDVRPCGGLLNQICDRSGKSEDCYQWKAGERNVPSQTDRGTFGARIRAHDIPAIVLMAPWLALAVSLLTLASRFVEFAKR